MLSVKYGSLRELVCNQDASLYGRSVADQERLGRQVVSRRCHNEFAVFHAARTDESVGEFLDGRLGSTNCNQFEAIVVIEMAMHGRQDVVAMIVLHVGQVLLQVPLVVVVDQRDAADDIAFACLLPVFDELGADHISDGHRAIIVTFFANHAIELAHQFRRERGAETGGKFLFAFGHTGEVVARMAAITRPTSEFSRCCSRLNWFFWRELLAPCLYGFKAA